MKQLRLVNIFYVLPLFFLVLTGSPNLNGGQIGSALGYTVILFLVIGYINFRKTTSKARLAIDLLVIVSMILCTYLSMMTNFALGLCILLWPLLHLIRPQSRRLKLLLRIFQGLILFCLIYFGINNYSFLNLLNTRVWSLLLVFVLLYLFIAMQFGWDKTFSMKRDLGSSFFITVLSLSLYAWLQFEVKYMLFLVALSAPAFIILFRLVGIEGKASQYANVRNFRILAIAGLTIFNLYLFLDTTQVLQAVKAGY